MNIPPKIQSAIERLNVELDYIQEKTQYGLAVLKPILDIFPNNNLLVQFYGYLNNLLFLINLYKQRIKIIVDLLQQETLSSEEILSMGEELSELLGRTVESKVGLENIISRIEKLL